MAEELNDLSRIEEECFALLESGELSLEAVLERYPQYASAIRPQLEAALWLGDRKRLFDLRPGYLPASRQRLVSALKSRTPPRKEPLWARWQRALTPGQLVFRLGVALVLLLAFLFTGQALVATAQAAVPGDALYGVKTFQEKLQLALSLSESGDARLHIRFAQRRLIEIETLVLENRLEYLPTAVADYQEQLSQAIAALQEVARQDRPQAQALASQLQQALSSHTQVIASMSQSLPPQGQADVQQTLEASAQGLMAVQELLPPGGTPPIPGTSTPTPVPPGTSTPVPTPSPAATSLPGLGSSPASATPTPTAPGNPSPTVEPVTTQNPVLRPSPTPTNTPTPTKTPKPTREPKPTKTPKPTKEPKPTKTPRPHPDPTRRPSRP